VAPRALRRQQNRAALPARARDRSADLQRCRPRPRAPAHGAGLSRGLAAGSGSGGMSDFDWGVRLSVWCSEALPFSERANGRREATFGSIDGAVFQPSTCERWGVDPRPAASLAPTLSDAPTLILAGEFDVLTPPGWGMDAAQTLSRSRVITIPGGFHTETTNWDGDGCAMSLAAAFFARPNAIVDSSASPACIAERTYPAFCSALGVAFSLQCSPLRLEALTRRRHLSS
jgi:pimeloyl-ACP methyl ester carboxylesterase